jgi:MoaA/NifB/PqqE/SkfB family radical SAM enzyme
MVQSFKTIFYDIMGFCNAKCPYCLSGRFRQSQGHPVSPEQFQETILTLRRKHILRKNGVISLYNWGEPFLHPKLAELIDILNKFGCRYAFSTNASRVPSIDAHFIRNLDQITFSMPGFSQPSYDRIHGFRFAVITRNIERIVDKCRSLHYTGRFGISFHVYRFNLEEIRLCEQFCNRLSILFNPYAAILNNWWDIYAWLNGTLPLERQECISNDLLHFDIWQIQNKSPSHYFCPQYRMLVIDESSNVLTCCQVPKGEHFSCGNLLREDFATIMSNRLHHKVCRTCIESGVAYYFNTSLVAPKSYQKTIPQRIKWFEYIAKKAFRDFYFAIKKDGHQDQK